MIWTRGFSKKFSFVHLYFCIFVLTDYFELLPIFVEIRTSLLLTPVVVFLFTPLIHTSYSHPLLTPIIHTSYSHLIFTPSIIHRPLCRHVPCPDPSHTLHTHLVHTSIPLRVSIGCGKSDSGRPSSRSGPSVWCGVQWRRAQAP